MSKFLDTQQISSELSLLIKEAKDKIVLVSPYLKVNVQIQERLRTRADVDGLHDITIVYGKSELKRSELNWMSRIQGLSLYEKGNLHAKCYLNEERAIICSMNLYDFSQQNNLEMGIMVTRADEPNTYDEIVREVDNIIVNARQHVLKKSAPSSAPIKPQKEVADPYSKDRIKGQLVEVIQSQLFDAYPLESDRVELSKRMALLRQSKGISWDDIKVILTKEQKQGVDDDLLKLLVGLEEIFIGIVEEAERGSDGQYPRVRLRVHNSDKSTWLNIRGPLPLKGQSVVGLVNNGWLNASFVLEV